MNLNEDYVVLQNSIVEWAKVRDDIAAIAIIGSRSDEANLYDEYSDLDLLLVSSNIESYFTQKLWLDDIRPYWFTFTESVPEANYFERRVLFDNGLDVDIILIDYEKLKTDSKAFPIVNEICRKPINVVFDRDNISKLIYELRSLNPEYLNPTEKEYAEIVSDFYFHVVWAYKKILRGEYWIGNRCVNCYMKVKLLKVIEWYEHCKNGVGYQTFYDGRYIEKWIEPALGKRLGTTFSNYNKLDMIEALNSMDVLFYELSNEVGSILGYTFPESKVSAIREWVKGL